MKKIALGFLAVLLAAGLTLLVSRPEGPPASSRGLAQDAAGSDPQPPHSPAGGQEQPAAKAPTLLPIAQTTSALHSRESSAAEDFLIISALLDQFRRHYGGNPIGDNDDIVAALRGRNAKALAYLPADHPALDDQGQLLDRWGTPYHFHSLSGKHMEIRSAGPDRKLFSGDDLLHPPATD